MTMAAEAGVRQSLAKSSQQPPEAEREGKGCR